MMGVNNLHMGKYVSLVFLPNIWGGDVNKNRIYALKRQLPTTYEYDKKISPLFLSLWKVKHSKEKNCVDPEDLDVMQMIEQCAESCLKKNKKQNLQQLCCCRIIH